MSFRLTTILWVFALLAAAMATFGPWGIFAALGVVGFWSHVFGKARLTVVEVVVIVMILGVLVALLVPAVSSARWSHRQARCMNNLKHISMALQEFAADRGEFPEASAPIVAGGSPVSWRLRLLYRLDKHSHFDAYQHREPWNSPGNQQLSQSPIDVYQCPGDVRVSATSPHTSYFAIVGEGTAWPSGRRRRLSEIDDGLDQTILLIEAPGRNVSWAEPRDLTVDEAVELLTDPSANPDPSSLHLSRGGDGFFYKQFAELSKGVHVAFANGRVAFLPLPISRDLAEALMTINGGENIADELSQLAQPQLDYAKIYAFGMFVFLALLPAVRLVRRRTAPMAIPPAPH